MNGKMTAFMDGMGKNSHVLHLIVGGYIAYLGFQIVADQVKAGSIEVVSSVGAAVLIVTGVPIALFSIWGIVRNFRTSEQTKNMEG